MHIVMDDVHKIEFIIGGICGILLILFWISCEIYTKIHSYKFKKDLGKKMKEEDMDESA